MRTFGCAAFALRKHAKYAALAMASRILNSRLRNREITWWGLSGVKGRARLGMLIHRTSAPRVAYSLEMNVNDELQALVACGLRIAFMIDGDGKLLGAAGDTDHVDTTQLAELTAAESQSVLTSLKTDDSYRLSVGGSTRVLILVAKFRRGSALLVGLEPTDASLLARMHETVARMVPEMEEVLLPPLDLGGLFEE